MANKKQTQQQIHEDKQRYTQPSQATQGIDVEQEHSKTETKPVVRRVRSSRRKGSQLTLVLLSESPKNEEVFSAHAEENGQDATTHEQEPSVVDNASVQESTRPTPLPVKGRRRTSKKTATSVQKDDDLDCLSPQQSVETKSSSPAAPLSANDHLSSQAKVPSTEQGSHPALPTQQTSAQQEQGNAKNVETTVATSFPAQAQGRHKAKQQAAKQTQQESHLDQTSPQTALDQVCSETPKTQKPQKGKRKGKKANLESTTIDFDSLSLAEKEASSSATAVTTTAIETDLQSTEQQIRKPLARKTARRTTTAAKPTKSISQTKSDTRSTLHADEATQVGSLHKAARSSSASFSTTVSADDAMETTLEATPASPQTQSSDVAVDSGHLAGNATPAAALPTDKVSSKARSRKTNRKVVAETLSQEPSLSSASTELAENINLVREDILTQSAQAEKRPRRSRSKSQAQAQAQMQEQKQKSQLSQDLDLKHKLSPSQNQEQGLQGQGQEQEQSNGKEDTLARASVQRKRQSKRKEESSTLAKSENIAQPSEEANALQAQALPASKATTLIRSQSSPSEQAHLAHDDVRVGSTTTKPQTKRAQKQSMHTSAEYTAESHMTPAMQKTTDDKIENNILIEESSLSETELKHAKQRKRVARKSARITATKSTPQVVTKTCSDLHAKKAIHADSLLTPPLSSSSSSSSSSAAAAMEMAVTGMTDSPLTLSSNPTIASDDIAAAVIATPPVSTLSTDTTSTKGRNRKTSRTKASKEALSQLPTTSTELAENISLLREDDTKQSEQAKKRPRRSRSQSKSQASSESYMDSQEQASAQSMASDQTLKHSHSQIPSPDQVHSQDLSLAKSRVQPQAQTQLSQDLDLTHKLTPSQDQEQELHGQKQSDGTEDALARASVQRKRQSKRKEESSALAKSKNIAQPSEEASVSQAQALSESTATTLTRSKTSQAKQVHLEHDGLHLPSTTTTPQTKRAARKDALRNTQSEQVKTSSSLLVDEQKEKTQGITKPATHTLDTATPNITTAHALTLAAEKTHLLGEQHIVNTQGLSQESPLPSTQVKKRRQASRSSAATAHQQSAVDSTLLTSTTLPEAITQKKRQSNAKTLSQHNEQKQGEEGFVLPTEGSLVSPQKEQKHSDAPTQTLTASKSSRKRRPKNALTTPDADSSFCSAHTSSSSTPQGSVEKDFAQKIALTATTESAVANLAVDNTATPVSLQHATKEMDSHSPAARSKRSARKARTTDADNTPMSSQSLSTPTVQSSVAIKTTRPNKARVHPARTNDSFVAQESKQTIQAQPITRKQEKQCAQNEQNALAAHEALAQTNKSKKTLVKGGKDIQQEALMQTSLKTKATPSRQKLPRQTYTAVTATELNATQLKQELGQATTQEDVAFVLVRQDSAPRKREKPKRTPKTIEQAVRLKCLDCCGGSLEEVRLCAIDYCPLHEFRCPEPKQKKSTSS